VQSTPRLTPPPTVHHTKDGDVGGRSLHIMSENGNGHKHAETASEPGVPTDQAATTRFARRDSGKLRYGEDADSSGRPKSGHALLKYEEMVFSLKKTGVITSLPKYQRPSGLASSKGGSAHGKSSSPPQGPPQGLEGMGRDALIPGTTLLPGSTGEARPALAPVRPASRTGALDKTDTEAGDDLNLVLQRQGAGHTQGRGPAPLPHPDLQALKEAEDTKSPTREQNVTQERRQSVSSNSTARTGHGDSSISVVSPQSHSLRVAKKGSSSASRKTTQKGSHFRPKFMKAHAESPRDADASQGSDDPDEDPVFKKLKYNDKVVTINVSGQVYQTYVHTLRKMPNTLLANYVEPGGPLLKHGHMFLDRDPEVFASILRYYRTDRLVQPSEIPQDLWADELLFYKIRNPLEFQMTAEEMKAQQIDQGMPPRAGQRQATWLFFEDPASSVLAKYQSMVGIFVILVAVAASITQTHPTFRLGVNKTFYGGFTTEEIDSIFQTIETVVVVYFTLEFSCRFWSTTKKIKFLKNVSNLIDLVAILPFYVELFPGVKGGSGLMVVRIVRLSRIFRIIGMVFKLGKYSSGAKVLVGTMLGCRRELTVLAVVFFMAITIFASSMYFCENPDITVMGSEFESVLTGMYWAGITITTVGYGDMIPQTRCGQSIAVIAAISGVFCLGLPISVITTKFTEKYRDMLQEQKVEDERKRFMEAKQQIQGMRGIRALAGNLTNPMGKVFGTFGDSFKSHEDNLAQIMKVATKVFAEMDNDNSNTIDRDELTTALEKLGFELPEKAIAYMMQFIDKDMSGVLEFDEFRTFVEMVVKGEIPTEEDIQNATLNANKTIR